LEFFDDFGGDDVGIGEIGAVFEEYAAFISSLVRIHGKFVRFCPEGLDNFVDV
jgi:hypothetical protein